MESIVIKQVRILDPTSAHHGQVRDLHIINGKIEAIDSHIKAAASTKTLEAEGSCLSPGWMDLQAHFFDPGAEHKEGLENGASAAAHGGFTRTILNASPLVRPDEKSAIAFLQSHSESFNCTLHPMACVSQKGEGKSLSEMRDLAKAGAIAFSDDAPINDTEMLRRALEYSEGMTPPVISTPIDLGLNSGAMMHEGATSTHMGITGNPSESEIMRIQRDLTILRYTGGKIHFSVISSAKSVDLIRTAKAEGLEVTCATTANHLRFIDEDLHDFDGTLKVMPPFRGKEDREALRTGVLDGTIDAVVSDHRPEDLEHHDVEFNATAFGIASIESTFAVTLDSLKKASSKEALSATIRALTQGPRAVLGLPPVNISTGSDAELTWFHPELTWTDQGATRGENIPQDIRQNPGNIKGNPLGTIRGNRLFLRATK